MAADTDILASLGLERMVDDEGFSRDAQGVITDPAGMRIVYAEAEFLRSLHHVIDRERGGAWRTVMKTTGRDCGKKIGVSLDAKLAGLSKPALAALPLEACLVFLERYFAVHGWGKLKLDLTDAAEHGLVVARLQHGYAAASLSNVTDFTDPMVAGMLEGFFEHISGQALAGEEIGCARRGAAHCTFVITAAERLAPVMPLLGRESADAIIARLRG
jgi:predicted hydrocarbon binding protein